MIVAAPVRVVARTGRGAANYPSSRRRPATRRPGRMRDYVMTTIALEHERLLVAERILHETERRHGLPYSDHPDLQPAVIDRFLVAYLPETRDGEPAPVTVEYAFTNSISDAIELLRRVVDETPDGWGSAAYVHDLDTGADAH